MKFHFYSKLTICFLAIILPSINCNSLISGSATEDNNNNIEGNLLNSLEPAVGDNNDDDEMDDVDNLLKDIESLKERLNNSIIDKIIESKRFMPNGHFGKRFMPNDLYQTDISDVKDSFLPDILASDGKYCCSVPNSMKIYNSLIFPTNYSLKMNSKVPSKGAKKAIRSSLPIPKKGKKRKQTYSIYVYRVLKQVHPDIGISSKAMSIMNSFVNDIFERIAQESSRLSHYNKRSTISSREIQTAVRLLLPGELAKHAVSEGTKAQFQMMLNKKGRLIVNAGAWLYFGLSVLSILVFLYHSYVFVFSPTKRVLDLIDIDYKRLDNVPSLHIHLCLILSYSLMLAFIMWFIGRKLKQRKFFKAAIYILGQSLLLMVMYFSVPRIHQNLYFAVENLIVNYWMKRTQTMNSRTKDKPYLERMHRVQYKYRCCGWQSSDDWSKFKTEWGRQYIEQEYPFSCCYEKFSNVEWDTPFSDLDLYDVPNKRLCFRKSLPIIGCWVKFRNTIIYRDFVPALVIGTIFSVNIVVLGIVAMTPDFAPAGISKYDTLNENESI
ncbi:hypothetical protein SNEBB_009698 [Seison nebaliae]|nr:hypothetical protein SNEBB_009698 [Seison nebaliae]